MKENTHNTACNSSSKLSLPGKMITKEYVKNNPHRRDPEMIFKCNSFFRDSLAKNVYYVIVYFLEQKKVGILGMLVLEYGSLNGAQNKWFSLCGEKDSYFVSHRSKVMHVWNNMSKSWPNLHFWVKNPCIRIFCFILKAKEV